MNIRYEFIVLFALNAVVALFFIGSAVNEDAPGSVLTILLLTGAVILLSLATISFLKIKK